jgi:lipoyl synthase
MFDRPQLRLHFPEWLKRPIPSGKGYSAVKSCLCVTRLRTVCIEAKCPNRAECFSGGTAAFLILGNTCTRNCAYCGVCHGVPLAPDPEEPEKIAWAASKMNLRHIVITSVTRDDLPDGGAAHFAECVNRCRKRIADISVEILIPDFRDKPKSLDTVLDCRPDILNHNMETVPRFYTQIRPGADYQHSLWILAQAQGRKIPSKSGIMVGLGETDEEVIALLRDLRKTGCGIVTIGQYLQPSDKQIMPRRYVRPEQFAAYEETGKAMGFDLVFSGPYVRSSYHSHEVYAQYRPVQKV